MYYEATLQYVTPDESGRDKRLSEHILIENPDGFADAEDVALEYAKNNIPADVDVSAIRRTRIMEFANTPTGSNSRIYYVTFKAITVDDNLKEKEVHYLVALYAPNIDHAQATAKTYQKQGFADMTIIQVTETKITTVVKAQ